MTNLSHRISGHLILTLKIVFAIWALTACRGGQQTVLPTPTSEPTPLPTFTGEPVRVGILINRSAEIVVNEWNPLLAYLSEAIGRPFEPVPLTFDDLLPAVESKRVDFAMTNSLQGVQARRLYGVEFVVTLSSTETGTEFSGLIVVRNDSDIQGIDDLHGKTAYVVSRNSSLGGYAMQAYHLLQKGFDPAVDFGRVIETSSHDNVILAVLNGTADVGFVRTGSLEKMLATGALTDLSELRILDLATDDFPYAHTTALYPEWAFFAGVSTDPALVEQVRTVLLDIPAGHPATASARVDHFVPVVDYSAVEEVIIALQLPSWDVVP